VKLDILGGESESVHHYVFPARLSYRQSCKERDDRCGRQRWARVFPGCLVSQPRYDDSSLTFNPTHPRTSCTRYHKVDPDQTRHATPTSIPLVRTSRYLFISGGLDGSEYSPELLLFNLGKLSSPFSPVSPALHIILTTSFKIK
jgi:hypothetical protein